MKINEINVNETIIQSKYKWDKKKWALTNIIIYLGSSLLMTAISLVTKMPPNYLVTGICIGVKAATEAGVNIFIKHKAEKNLRTIIRLLRKEGIKVRKMNLQKAKMGTKKPERIMTSNSCEIVSEGVTVFQDNAGKLNALRQVRSELVYTLGNSSNTPVLHGSYTEYIQSEEEAQKILFKMKG